MKIFFHATFIFFMSIKIYFIFFVQNKIIIFPQYLCGDYLFYFFLSLFFFLFDLYESYLFRKGRFKIGVAQAVDNFRSKIQKERSFSKKC